MRGSFVFDSSRTVGSFLSALVADCINRADLRVGLMLGVGLLATGFISDDGGASDVEGLK